MAASISLSVGLGLAASNAAAAMIWPAWQDPHCGTSISCQASCTGCVPSAESPSTVVIGAFTLETFVTHDRIGLPLRCTVQAPQMPMPHPYLVPFRSSSSRRTHNKGMSAGTSTVRDLPLMVNLYAM